MSKHYITYCNGKRCALRTRCQRYIDGKRVNAKHGDASWMDACDAENREGFIPQK